MPITFEAITFDETDGWKELILCVFYSKSYTKSRVLV